MLLNYSKKMHACVNVKLTTVNQLLQQYGRDFNPGFSDITIKFSFFGATGLWLGPISKPRPCIFSEEVIFSKRDKFSLDSDIRKCLVSS